MNWQPIETAPKDGSDILLWKGWPVIAKYEDGEFLMDGWAEVNNATHWAPIEPPKEAS